MNKNELRKYAGIPLNEATRTIDIIDPVREIARLLKGNKTLVRDAVSDTILEDQRSARIVEEFLDQIIINIDAKAEEKGL
jgi:hypothetical protein